MRETHLSESAVLSLINADKYMLNGEYNRAFKLLSDLHTQYPNSGEINYAFGTFYLQVEDFDKAIHFFSQTCQLVPSNFQAIFGLMDAFELVNSHQDVATLNEFMLAKFPQQPEVIYKSAQYCSEIGNLTKAITLANQCIKLCEHSTNLNLLQAYAWLLLIKLDSKTHQLSTITRLTDLMESNVDDTNSDIIMMVNYAIGEVYHHLKKPQSAFSHWQLANKYQLSKASFRTEALAGFFEKIMQSHKSIGHTEAEKTIQDKAALVPIFIVGLPRTGSTLLETLLSSHSLVDSMGETNVVSNQLVPVLEQQFKKPYPDFMQDIAEKNIQSTKQTLLDSCAQIYINAVHKRQLKACYIVDKLPANFQSIGLIKSVFPNAKIIHLTRNFEDVALSIFRHHFASNEPYFCDIKELSKYNKMYLNLMTFWNEKFGEQIFTLRYENLVSEPASSIKRVLEYCGLTAEEACFTTGKNESIDNSSNILSAPIKTLSAIQVRSPISTNAVGTSSVYRSLLTPYLD